MQSVETELASADKPEPGKEFSFSSYFMLLLPNASRAFNIPTAILDPNVQALNYKINYHSIMLKAVGRRGMLSQCVADWFCCSKLPTLLGLKVHTTTQ
jgi:hypothetical protein